MAYYIVPEWFFSVGSGTRETIRLCGREMGFCKDCAAFPDYGQGGRCKYTGREIKHPYSQYCDEWEHSGKVQ